MALCGGESQNYFFSEVSSFGSHWRLTRIYEEAPVVTHRIIRPIPARLDTILTNSNTLEALYFCLWEKLLPNNRVAKLTTRNGRLYMLITNHVKCQRFSPFGLWSAIDNKAVPKAGAINKRMSRARPIVFMFFISPFKQNVASLGRSPLGSRGR